MGTDAPSRPFSPFHNQNPSQRTASRSPPLALHQWASIDTCSVAAVTWDDFFLQMGIVRHLVCYNRHLHEWFASALIQQNAVEPPTRGRTTSHRYWRPILTPWSRTRESCLPIIIMIVLGACCRGILTAYAGGSMEYHISHRTISDRFWDCSYSLKNIFHLVSFGPSMCKFMYRMVCWNIWWQTCALSEKQQS
jgi:hypothetical protein